ncbi:MAG: hypothetical protein A2504_10170 [Bdellovibrionales bacterium RIFOXYD12_FULL_39_22]|nr:MAG: hypothetical protein A2385_17805 [Bdellovibrionales bacterium RIFOXYB1_FULL_39_21]OFZ43975.1 MAG: hypothetical protein A2485_04475 [Bdellovibrionales bacterium RIFOXYC12_FULL_39_17]OFZ48347.1 MAG: hypothetical protein A2404_01890 [Bdellovibrionales bacterium RIFOXYC1_FULL_39_130]OFZ71835.1 MAG: hypothetical protein A2451_12755 [Bdellovibrionales bacterium RIFOXYC2_FULL_39_8]OFZ76652.1 MAG: hypothetical protein A2560_17485 [Bdellovibrionales bacterium RIFOXYD1_FULL_39_84]OFZ94938.1 MAG:
MKKLTSALFCIISINSYAQDWILKSNKIAEEFTMDIAKDSPETASSLGYSQFDSMAVNFENDMETKDLVFYAK